MGILRDIKGRHLVSVRSRPREAPVGLGPKKHTSLLLLFYSPFTPLLLPFPMTPNEYLSILHVAERLKDTPRHCTTSKRRVESVAEHSWRISLMAFLLKDEFPEADINKVVSMCLIHDLGEAFTGDIPTFEKSGKDEEAEYRALTDWIGAFPETLKKEFEELFAEMRERKTPEARLFKALDKLEAVIQHNESDISSWLPLEYDLQFTYGKEEAGQFPYLKQLRDRIDLWTKEKINNAQK